MYTSLFSMQYLSCLHDHIVILFCRHIVIVLLLNKIYFATATAIQTGSVSLVFYCSAVGSRGNKGSREREKGREVYMKLLLM